MLKNYALKHFFFKKIWKFKIRFVPLHSKSRDRAVVARQAHNLKVGGSTPSPATKWKFRQTLSFLFYCTSQALREPGAFKMLRALQVIFKIYFLGQTFHSLAPFFFTSNAPG